MSGQLRNLALGLGFTVHLLRKRLSTGAWHTDACTRAGRIGDVLRRAPGPRILVHGVSVGETNALAPLVDALAGSRPEPDVVVSAGTETGFALARRIHARHREVVRFPMDFTWMVARFLDGLRPDLVVLAELELWPSFLAACARREIPVCVVNARMSARSFRGYRLGRPFVRRMFSRLALVAAQTETYRERFAVLGAPVERTCVAGSLKWDAARCKPAAAVAQQLAAEMGIDRSRPLIVAGSTGPGEEAALLRDLPGGCQLLLAPRNPDRWDEVASLRPGMPRRSRDPDSRTDAAGPASGFPGAAHASAAARRGTTPEPPRSDVFLLDTIGELTVAYFLADFVFVGRSLGPMGGSNPLESVALGKPTVIGPHHENFAGVAADLVEAGGLVVSAQPIKAIRAWLDDPVTAEAAAEAGLRAVERNRGTAARTAERVLGLLPADRGRDAECRTSTSISPEARGRSTVNRSAADPAVPTISGPIASP